MHQAAHHVHHMQGSCDTVPHSSHPPNDMDLHTSTCNLCIRRSPGGAWKLVAMGLAGLATLKMCGGFAQQTLGLRPQPSQYGRWGLLACWHCGLHLQQGSRCSVGRWWACWTCLHWNGTSVAPAQHMELSASKGLRQGRTAALQLVTGACGGRWVQECAASG